MSFVGSRRDKFPLKTAIALLLGIVLTAYLCSEFRTPLRGYPTALTGPYQPAATQPVRSIDYSADIPGTLVCPDPTALHDLLYDYAQYRAHRGPRPHDSMGRNQPPALPPNPFPRPSVHDCAIVPPGTSMRLAANTDPPQVTVRMSNGATIHGYTLAQMTQPDAAAP